MAQFQLSYLKISVVYRVKYIDAVGRGLKLWDAHTLIKGRSWWHLRSQTIAGASRLSSWDSRRSVRSRLADSLFSQMKLYESLSFLVRIVKIRIRMSHPSAKALAKYSRSFHTCCKHSYVMFRAFHI